MVSPINNSYSSIKSMANCFLRTYSDFNVRKSAISAYSQSCSNGTCRQNENDSNTSNIKENTSKADVSVQELVDKYSLSYSAAKEIVSQFTDSDSDTNEEFEEECVAGCATLDRHIPDNSTISYHV